MRIEALYPFFCGLLIGICDLVPGISGGTMALILGIYEPLMQSIADLKNRSLKNFKLLVFVLLGIGVALLGFSSFFHHLLQNGGTRSYLYSLFFGLVCGSTWFVGKQITRWTFKRGVLFLGGALVAWVVTQLPTLIEQPTGLFFYAWLVLGGSMAVLAMLLPGISGSYVLMILGPYPLVIESVAKLSRLDFSSLAVLLPLGCGIALGGLFFSKWIAFALKEFKDVTLTLLMGFMAGASFAVWPFSGIPPFESTTFLSFATMLGGVVCVLGIESIAVRKVS